MSLPWNASILLALLSVGSVLLSCDGPSRSSLPAEVHHESEEEVAVLPILGGTALEGRQLPPWLLLGGEVGSCVRFAPPRPFEAAHGCACGGKLCQVLLVVEEKDLEAGTRKCASAYTQCAVQSPSAGRHILLAQDAAKVREERDQVTEMHRASSERCTAVAQVARRAPALVVSGIDRDAVDRVLTKNRGRILTCVESSMLVHGCLTGSVRVLWQVATGRVVEATVLEDAASDSEFASCALSAAKQFRFPPEANGSVEYTWSVHYTGDGAFQPKDVLEHD